MIRTLLLTATLLGLTGCASSPDPEADTAPAVLSEFGELGKWPGVWRVPPPKDESDEASELPRPTSGTLRIFPVLAGTFLEATLLYRLDNGLPQLARQFWRVDELTGGYRVWTFGDGGVHYDGVLRPTEVEGQISGVIGGVDGSGDPIRGTLTVTTRASSLRFTLQIEDGGDTDSATVEFVR